jgi:hypothetical protein
MVSRKENSALAQSVMQEAIGRYAVADGQLTLHQDPRRTHDCTHRPRPDGQAWRDLSL